MTDAKILIVEDDKSSTARLEECLENLGVHECVLRFPVGTKPLKKLLTCVPTSP